MVVTHDLASILEIGTNSIYLDIETKSILAEGPPGDLLEISSSQNVRDFLSRGQGQKTRKTPPEHHQP